MNCAKSIIVFIELAPGPIQFMNQFVHLYAIQNTVVQSIGLQGNRVVPSNRHRNSSGTGIAKFAAAAPLMTVQLTASTGASPAKWCLQLKWYLRGGTTLAGVSAGGAGGVFY